MTLENILSSFDKFSEPGQNLLSEYQRENYRSKYLDLRNIYIKTAKSEKVSILDDIVFETELLKSSDLDYDTILKEVEKYHETNSSDIILKEKILHSIDGSIFLRSKKQLIEEFINNIDEYDVFENINKNWDSFFKNSEEKEFRNLISEENLHEEKARAFLESSFRNNNISFNGDTISSLMIIKPSRFGTNKNTNILNDRKERVKEKLLDFFTVYSNQK